MSLVRCSRHEKIERAEYRLLRAHLRALARNVQRLRNTALELRKEPPGPLGRERVELRVSKGANHLAMRRERSSKQPNAESELDQSIQFARDIPAWSLGYHLCVELLEGALDCLECTQVAGEHPLADRCDNEGASSAPTWPPPSG